MKTQLFDPVCCTNAATDAYSPGTIAQQHGRLTSAAAPAATDA